MIKLHLTGIVSGEMIPLIFLHGLTTAALTALGMTYLHRGREGATRDVRMGRGLVAGVAVISLVYPLIYVLFGAFVFIPLLARVSGFTTATFRCRPG